MWYGVKARRQISETSNSQHSRKRNAEKGINQTFSNTNHYQVAHSTRAKLVFTPSTTMHAAATVCAAAICSPSTSPRSVHQRRCDRPVRQNRLSLLTKASVENTASSVGVTQRVLITGSTRGLGFELARSFLARGDKVFVTSRDAAKVREAVATLRETFGSDAVAGLEADVSKAESVEAMANACVDAFDGVDVWINNAGSNGYQYDNLEEADPTVLEEVVLTNSLGSLLCTRQAIKTMRNTSGRGHIFNMEGAGSDGSATRKFAAYGHTKAGMAQLSKTMAEELKNDPIGVHTISPGMVFTELISSGRFAFGSQGRLFVNVLAEPADSTAELIVEKLKVATESPDSVNRTIAIKILTPDVALKKMFGRFVLGENKDRYYPEAD